MADGGRFDVERRLAHLRAFGKRQLFERLELFRLSLLAGSQRGQEREPAIERLTDPVVQLGTPDLDVVRGRDALLPEMSAVHLDREEVGLRGQPRVEQGSRPSDILLRHRDGVFHDLEVPLRHLHAVVRLDHGENHVHLGLAAALFGRITSETGAR